MADDVIAGYTCVNDLSNNGDIDIDPGKARVKGFDRSKPIGPVVVDHKTVPQDAEISLRLNGTTKQRATIDGYHYSVGEVIEEVTSYITLDSGDVITMGSPAGISHVEEGETMEVEIEGIGVLRTEIAETE
jgi:2-keto-4-pentenoate hydratase/2-oxohepta-3-ene-1,7-dioic acid hydratase in catechol pathway